MLLLFLGLTDDDDDVLVAPLYGLCPHNSFSYHTMHGNDWRYPIYLGEGAAALETPRLRPLFFIASPASSRAEEDVDPLRDSLVKAEASSAS